MSWLVDGHAHFHPVFDRDDFLEGVLASAAHANHALDGSDAIRTVCLLMADPDGVDSLELLLGPGRPAPASWDMRGLDGGGAELRPPGGRPRVLLLPGRQLRTSERLELLALDCIARIPDGLPLAEAARRARDADAVPVIPWGFGKWWRSRGRVVRGLLDGHAAKGHPIHVGDNGNRPSFPLRSPLLGPDRPPGVLDLPGSDPLPFPDHARRAASCGFVLPGDPDPHDPGRSLREALRALESDPPRIMIRRGVLPFAADQVRMQLRRRGR